MSFPDEKILITVRRHPATLVASSAFFIVAVLLAIARNRFHVESRVLGSGLVWSIVVGSFVLLLCKVTNWSVQYIVFTSERVLIFTGPLGRRMLIMPLGIVTDVWLRRSVGGRLFGYGELGFESVVRDQAIFSIDHLPFPLQILELVSRQLFPRMTRSQILQHLQTRGYSSRYADYTLSGRGSSFPWDDPDLAD